jgi:hypothetical protein
MQTLFTYCKKQLIWILVLVIFVSCHNIDTNEVSGIYKTYHFDSTVITRLPLYDSLASAILEKYAYFKQFIKETDAYRSFKYVPNSSASDEHKSLPAEISPKIDRYFTELGAHYILGFTVYIDSSLKIHVRNRPSQTDPFNIEENLSYFPQDIKIQHRQYPVKDTLLNKRWQYWVRFNRQTLF